MDEEQKTVSICLGTTLFDAAHIANVCNLPCEYQPGASVPTIVFDNDATEPVVIHNVDLPRLQELWMKAKSLLPLARAMNESLTLNVIESEIGEQCLHLPEPQHPKAASNGLHAATPASPAAE